MPLEQVVCIRSRTDEGHDRKGLEMLPEHVVYVTVNMCNQGIRVFPKNFSEYAYSLNWSGNTRILCTAHIH